MEEDFNMARSTCSGAAKDLDDFLCNQFSKSFETFKYKNISLCIPPRRRKNKKGGTPVGYYFGLCDEDNNILSLREGVENRIEKGATFSMI
jgi:hypothetical protein